MGTHYRGKPREIRALDAYIKLLRCAATLERKGLARLRALDLSENQFGVLETLWHLGPLAQCDIGRKLLTSRPNVTLVVDELERRGLVRRERSAEDRRSVRVHLTGSGRKLIERIFPEHAAAIAREFSALSSAEQEELARLCRKLGLRSAAAPPSALGKPEK
jgi:MarR family transcriptional regulator, 2-MHQ and catechol-resistance regulon repressor